MAESGGLLRLPGITERAEIMIQVRLHWNVGRRWLPITVLDPVGHTGGHTGDDANVCLSEHISVVLALEQEVPRWDDAKNVELKRLAALGSRTSFSHRA